MAVTRLPRAKGVHNVLSGFNAWMRAKGHDPVAFVKAAEAAGDLKTRPTKGGFMVYLPADAD